MATFINAIEDPPVHPDVAIDCDVVVLRPTQLQLPHGLLPTQLQMNSPHYAWIDMIPFPEIRNNLIKQHCSFNHKEFLTDVVGDMAYLTPAKAEKKQNPGAAANPKGYPKHVGVDSGASDKGLILWGEPHLRESWEASPGFLRKWAWVTRGCDGIIEVTNRWRASRGEMLLDVSLLSS